ncbi:MAG: hypothetical protein K0U86_23515 [Planctomycetes bacterium]|nr:hypothetical protein [Planctomycetota bacterium]MCH9727882.1 hypothetical protein [Planctomycetota bacterium]MCH9775450.1 hypothetical protein [Planctomycetota bacterium]MCH9792735.1 hypothetical protein [Planctomycetota bacterium]
MREDIAEAYRKMQENPAPMIFSQLPDDTNHPVEENSHASTATMTAQTDDGDDDFDLDQSIDVREYQSSDDDFQLSGSLPVSNDKHIETIPLAREESAKEAEANTTTEKEAKPKSEQNQKTPAEDHSVATGGDVLLNVAMEEEKEDKKRRKGSGKRRRRRTGKVEGGIVVYCPNGHRIRVRQEYRGALGKCPACSVMYLVPSISDKEDETADQVPADEAAKTDEDIESGTLNAGAYTQWFNDLKLHSVDPTKLKLKPNSLEKSFVTIDLALSPEKILILGLVKSGLLGGGSKEKQDKIRAEISQHLREEKEDSEIPAASVQMINADQIPSLRVAFPTMYDHESVFAGVPVFGKGRIAIALPKQEDAKENQYLTLSLTEYRKFFAAMSELYSLTNLGQDSGIPLTDQIKQVTCHYSEESFDILDNENLPLYEADSEIELTLAGRQCQACELIVSEDSRKKEKIGGKTGKGISKAKCPKCNEKFGNNSLWQITRAEIPKQTSPAE